MARSSVSPQREKSPVQNGRDAHSPKSNGRRMSDGSDNDTIRTRKEDKSNKTVERITIEDADAAFVLGRQGKTKEKLSRVSGAVIEVTDSKRGKGETTLEVRGDPLCCKKALKYCKYVMSQRVGPVFVDPITDDDGDMTAVIVPQEAAGFVTGKKGNFLRTIEEEWKTIMFFAERKGSGDHPLSKEEKMDNKVDEELVIFGAERERQGAKLKVMSAVETKIQGHFTGGLKEFVSDKDGYDIDIYPLDEKDLSYALGRKGLTRRKLACASECVVEYLGTYAHFFGTKIQRQKAKQYMNFLFGQLAGAVSLNPAEQTDCTVIDVPIECVGYITGQRRETLGRIEEEWGVLMFFLEKAKDSEKDSSRDTEKLAIFGPRRSRRGAELKIMSSVESKKEGFFTDDADDKISPKDDFSTDRRYLKDDELSYALGRYGSTRKKLAASSGCVIEYVGNVVFMCGTKAERVRAREYIQWLLDQRKGSIDLPDRQLDGRDDVVTCEVPKESRGYISGNKGFELRRIENDTQTFMFMAHSDDEERLLIFGTEKESRDKAKRMIKDLIDESYRSRKGWGKGYGGGGYDSWYGGYDDGYGRGGSGYDRRDRGRDRYRDDRYRDSRDSRDKYSRDSYYGRGGGGGGRRDRDRHHSSASRSRSYRRKDSSYDSYERRSRDKYRR